MAFIGVCCYLRFWGVCACACVCVDPSVMLEDLDFAAALGGSTSGTKPKSKRAAKKAVPKDGELPVT